MDAPASPPAKQGVRFGLREKLFLASILLIVAVVVIHGGLLAHLLEEWLTELVEREILRHAQTSRLLLESYVLRHPGEASLDHLADQLGQSTEARVTIIDARGGVLGDSMVGEADLSQVENHLHRPEVQEALQSGMGKAVRHSSTVKESMVYLALPFGNPDSRGVVRLAMPLEFEERIIHHADILILAALVPAFFAALLLSWTGTGMLTRALRDLYLRVVRLHPEGMPSPRDEIGALATSLDVQEQKLETAFRCLAQERDRLETMLESLGEGVIAISRESVPPQVMLINDSARRLLGLPADAEVGDPLHALLPATLLEQWDTAQTPGIPLEFSLPGQRTLVAQSRRLKDGSGMLVVVRDISEKRRVERMRRELVINVSHELRTPASVILANAETLSGDPALMHSPATRLPLEAILRHGQRMGRLISDLLDLSRLEAGVFPLNPAPQVVEEAVMRVLGQLDEQIALRENRIRMEIDGHEQVLADGAGLDRILFHLLDNASRHGVELVVGLEPGEGSSRIRVEDDGPGLTPEQMDRLFERFYRPDEGRARSGGGSGLGLSIVKHLVEQMGGSVGVEAAKGGGACFWFTLPRAEPMVEEDEEEWEA